MAGEPWRWSTDGPVDGVVTVKVSSWVRFTEHLHEQMMKYPTYIWRGERRSDWTLVATLYRPIETPRDESYQYRIGRHRRAFLYSIRGRRGPNPPKMENENDQWAMGQAHGLVTPLLDWTMSPFVAAYFAFWDVGSDQTEYRAVYALARSIVSGTWSDREMEYYKAKFEKEKEEKEKKKGIMSTVLRDYEEEQSELFREREARKEANPEMEFVQPFTDDNARLVNQSGLFSKTPKGEDVESFVRAMFKGDTNGFTLVKFLIPDSERVTSLIALNRMNINHLTLFPDLYGASVYCNLSLEIPNYSSVGDHLPVDIEALLLSSQRIIFASSTRSTRGASSKTKGRDFRWTRIHADDTLNLFAASSSFRSRGASGSWPFVSISVTACPLPRPGVRPSTSWRCAPRRR